MLTEVHPIAAGAGEGDNSQSQMAIEFDSIMLNWVLLHAIMAAVLQRLSNVRENMLIALIGSSV